MEPVSSVAAFVARYVESPTQDAEAEELFATLDEEEKLALRSQERPPAARRSWIETQSGTPWSEARLRHVEERAAVHLRRILQSRGLWR